ncbi:pyridoxamine 5'-phosphate oxidase family protein [Actinokineospora sp. NBRC 105648]|uniref:pyridoxamine 5'-phosphate oxidase family protein n=1 Tax=Actinokineospora sp. NBRC 105648 TaxID=3032206 RepID=UPI002552DBFA|nr:pyridoxamine 5'-phosphate oxidase family protein [Actinokineospora sp. NBRC 105648]
MSIDPLPPAGADLLRLEFAEVPPAAAHATGPREPAGADAGGLVLDRLTAPMIELVHRMELAYVATADAEGACDSGLRAGPPGFIQVLDDRHLAYAEFDAPASLDNIGENPHVGILLVDAAKAVQVNGRATVLGEAELPNRVGARHWVLVEVEEAYLHRRAAGRRPAHTPAG